MRIKSLFIFALILIAGACQTDLRDDPTEKYGAFTRQELTPSNLSATSRTPDNGHACVFPWPWKIGINLHNATSSSTATSSYYFWPSRSQFYGPNGYNEITTSALPGRDATVLTIKVENIGKTNLQYSIDNGSSWTQINRNGAPSFFTITVPSTPNCQLQTEPQMYVYQTIKWKSVSCYQDSDNWTGRVNLQSCTNGSYPYYANTGGGMYAGWNWSPPSYPCSYTP